MRISLNMMHSQVLDGLMSDADKLSEAQNRASTGKQILKPSDDPMGAARAMNLRSSLSQLDQMSRNTSAVKNQLGLTDNALKTIASQLSTVRRLAVQAGNAALSTPERNAILVQLDEVSTQLVNAGNVQYDGKYILAGNETRTAPIAKNPGGAPPYAYNGDTGTQSVYIAPGITIASNITGDKVFNMGGSADPNTPDVFKMIADLKENILNDNTDAVSKSISSIDTNLTNVNAIRTQVGARINRIDDTANQLADTKLNMKSMLSDTEDVDLAQAITDVQVRTNAYQAAIATAQKVFSLSLSDYLK